MQIKNVCGSSGAAAQPNDLAASSNRFSNDFSLIDIRFLNNPVAQTKSIDTNMSNPIYSFSEQATTSSSSPLSLSSSSSSSTTLSNAESSVIQSTINYTNATNVSSSSSSSYFCVGQSRNCTEDLPERVSKLDRTSYMSDASVQACDNGDDDDDDDVVNVSTPQTRDAVCGVVCRAPRVGNVQMNSTAAAASMQRAVETETATQNGPVVSETQTSATNRSSSTSLVNIESKQMRFSRDRLLHASVSSTAHAFFDLFKFNSRNSESSGSSCSSNSSYNRHNNGNNKHTDNLSRSANRDKNIFQKNSCAVAAMRLNVPNQDQTAVAAREPSSISVSTRVNQIDSSKTVVNISNAHSHGGDGLQTTLGTMITTTTSKSCPSASHIFENGTLLGAIVPPAQPSLTIQVNQHEQQSHQTQVRN